MFVALALASLLTAGPASAESTLLRCNLSAGPDQEVTVRQGAGGLELHELTTAGARVQRPLARAEWESRRLRLRAELAGEENVLTAEKGAWTFYGRGAGMNIVVLADCW